MPLFLIQIVIKFLSIVIKLWARNFVLQVVPCYSCIFNVFGNAELLSSDRFNICCVHIAAVPPLLKKWTRESTIWRSLFIRKHLQLGNHSLNIRLFFKLLPFWSLFIFINVIMSFFWSIPGRNVVKEPSC